MLSNETKEQRFKRVNKIKTWGFDANEDERSELGKLVLKSGITKKKAVLKAMRAAYSEQNKEEENASV